MKRTEHRPIVTVEQAVGYDPARPETATPSRIVNVIIECLPHVGGANARSIAKRLGISERAVAGAVEFDTGMLLADFLEQWRAGMILRTKREKTGERGDLLARRLGFSGRTALWLFMERKGLKARRKGAQARENAETWLRIERKMREGL